MAQHNYFGFTAPVTQYAPQPSAYGQTPAAAAAYVPASQTYAPAARQAPQYQPYDTGHTQTYAYTPAQAPAPPARPVQTVVTVAVTPQYQAVQVKPTYSSGYGTPARSVGNVAAVAKPAAQAVTSGYAYGGNAAYSTPHPPANIASNSVAAAAAAAKTPNSTQSSGSSYDAALYSAATNYYQQKQNTANAAASNWINKENKTFSPFAGQKKPGGGAGRGSFTQNRNFHRKPGLGGTMQTHYCEVCKISCAGPQTYKEHLEGQKHKKKEAQQKTGNAAGNMKAGQSQLKCDLCDITCTGTDAYTAHIRGAKHVKTMNLHMRLGKPIPSTDPTIVTAGQDNKTVTESKAPVPAVKKVMTPAIKFVGGSTLHSLNAGQVKEEVKPTTAPAAASVTPLAAAAGANTDDTQDDMLLPGEKAIQPVGHEYIEETLDANGKLLTFFCKLCDCKFNDPNAKNMHMKGRRHRGNYKKKVDPDLIVEMKPNTKGKRMQQERERSKNIREVLKRQRQEDMAAVSEIRLLESDRFYPGQAYNENYSDRIETLNDKHIMAKHAVIYPNEDQLQAIQVIVSACEKALKLCSDTLHEEQKPAKKDADGKEIRLMKGVMRVGDLAKGLLLGIKLDIRLVVLCSEKPTVQLLHKLAVMLPDRLKTVITDEEFTVAVNTKEAAVVVENKVEPRTRCTLSLTSPLMREDNTEAADAEKTSSSTNRETASDILDKQKCIDALAALRHSKWFQARASTIPSCVPLVRVLKYLNMHEDKFSALQPWAIELLLERCMSTAVSPMGPGDAMRRFFEALASGICLPGSPGLSDPCEKDPIDAFGNMNAQSREIVTCYAQTCLRQIAFNQIHKVLGIEPLSMVERTPAARKRPFKSTDSQEQGEGKKEKTETDAATTA